MFRIFGILLIQYFKILFQGAILAAITCVYGARSEKVGLLGEIMGGVG